jgi:hypothetical protein
MALEYFTVEHIGTKDLIRIFSGIEINPEVCFNGSPCWIWTRALSWGYGHVWLEPTITSTHRIMYAWLVAPLPKGKKYGELDHLCRRRACCNPLHLEFVSQQVNLERGNGSAAKNKRKTHCPKGHALEGDNVYHPKTHPHYRSCVMCIRQRYQTQKLDPIWKAKAWKEARERGQRKAALRRMQQHCLPSHQE